MKILVSGLLNTETTTAVRGFPVNYYPIDYTFFGIDTAVSGVAFNIAKALRTLGDEVRLTSMVGNDFPASYIQNELNELGISTEHLLLVLRQTPSSVVLYDPEGKRQIYCDLRDIQDREFDSTMIEKAIEDSDLLVLCNINFNRPLLKQAKKLGKLIATDVHVLSDIHDEYNKDFMEYADLLFLSDEKLPCDAKEFLWKLKETYSSKIIVIGLGKNGALLYVRSEDKMYHLEAATVGEVVNTLGAGDALFSCFLHYYVKGYSAVEALIRAEIFAALKIRFNGAAKGFCKEDMVEEYYRTCDVRVQEISVVHK